MSFGEVKLQYNNEIIKIKQFILQTKIHVINNLSRKAKALKNRKGTTEQQEKNNRKADCFVAEIMHLKSIDRNELANFAMQNIDNLNSHLNNPLASKERAMARLLLHKVLHPKFQNIKSKFSSIPISSLLERDPKKLNKKKRKEKLKLSKKGNGIKVKNTNDSTIENHKSGEDEDEVKRSIHNNESASDLDMTPLDASENTKAISKTKAASGASAKSKLTGKTKAASGSFVVKSMDVDETENQLTGVLEKQSKLRNCSDSEDSSEADQFFTYDSPKKITRKNVPSKISGTKILIDMDNLPPDAKPETTIDSFFVTNSGDTYETLALPRPADVVDKESANRNRKMRRAAMFGNDFIESKRKNRDKIHHSFKANDRNKTAPRNNSNSNRQPPKDDDRFQRNKKNYTFESDNNRPQANVSAGAKTEEKLHPSWEAKKNKSTLLPFQGNKIVFDD